MSVGLAPANDEASARLFAAVGGGADSALWSQLAEARDPAAFGQAWLAITARTFPPIRQAALLLSPGQGRPPEPVARWAATADADDVERLTRHTGGLLQQAFDEGRAILGNAQDDRAGAAFPIRLDAGIVGAVVVETVVTDAVGGRRLLRRLHWASAWVEAFSRRGDAATAQALSARATALLEVTGAALAEPRLADAARAVADDVARRLGCERGLVGFRRRHHVRLAAAAQTAGLNASADLVRAVETAMNECVDHDMAMAAPGGAEGGRYRAYGHEGLRARLDGACVLTVPLGHGDAAFGALTLVRHETPFGPDEIALAEVLATAAAPVLAERREMDRSLAGLLLGRLRRLAAACLGPRHLGAKAAALVLVGLAVAAWFVQDTFRVTAHGQIQGEVRRVMSAPFDGYLRTASVRAGQIVRDGEAMAELQDNDLVLDRLRHLATRRQYQLEHDRALAKRDLAAVSIARSQIEQKDAEIELSDQMLARAQIRAPFDGVVVSGDLSQSIGKPVSRGDTLFELAPLDRYRVTLVVPEAEIGAIRPGAPGRILLTALPETAFPISVVSVTPVARTADGINGFEVLADIGSGDPRIRPAMEGTAKIDAGEARLVWIWTHGFTHWLRVKLWPWLP